MRDEADELLGSLAVAGAAPEGAGGTAVTADAASLELIGGGGTPTRLGAGPSRGWLERPGLFCFLPKGIIHRGRGRTKESRRRCDRDLSLCLFFALPATWVWGGWRARGGGAVEAVLLLMLVCHRSLPALALPFPNGQKARRAEGGLIGLWDVAIELGAAVAWHLAVWEALTRDDATFGRALEAADSASSLLDGGARCAGEWRVWGPAGQIIRSRAGLIRDLVPHEQAA